MPDETATAKFDADVEPLLSALQKLEEDLNRLEANFATLGPAASQQLQSVEASARAAGGGIQAASTGGAGAMQSLGGGLLQAASAGRILVSALAAIGPYIGGLPDSVGRFVGPLKKMYAAVALTDAAMNAFSGRLGILGTAFAYMDARTLGASRQMAAFGVISGFALSTTIASARGAVAAVAHLGRAIAGVATTAAASMGPLFGIGGPLLALGVAIAGIKRAFDLGGEFSDLKEQTGESISNLVVLKQAFVNAGLGSDGVGTAINRLQKSLGGLNEEGKSTKKALKELGLSSAELGVESPIGQIEKLQAAFAGVTDEARRTEIAQNLFGKSGGKMLALLNDPAALATARGQTGKLGEELERNAARFDKTSDAIGAMNLKFDQLFVGAAAGLAPQLEIIFDQLSRTDWTDIGKRLGEVAGHFRIVAAEVASALNAINGFVNNSLDILLGKKAPEVSLPISRDDRERRRKKTEEPDIKVGKMRELAGGGAFHIGAGNGADPMLDENRRQTRLLETIAQSLKTGALRTGGLERSLVPVAI